MFYANRPSRRQNAGTNRQTCTYHYLGSPRTTFALSVASVCMADFAKPSKPPSSALDVAFTVGYDRVQAHGSAAIAPAMRGGGADLVVASSNTGISNYGGRRLARRETCTAFCGVRPPPVSRSKCEMHKSEATAFTNRTKSPRPGRGAAAGAEAEEDVNRRSTARRTGPRRSCCRTALHRLRCSRRCRRRRWRS